MHSGLVSVTFRQLAPAEIIALVRQAGLDAVEWGGDVHVPHGDLPRAREVYERCAEAGLTVASYGSYYRLGRDNDSRFRAVIETALELRAPLIRVWPGAVGSAAASEDYRATVAEEARGVAEQAAAAGLAIAFEFHANSLTDTADSARRLLDAAARDNLFTYWQPPTALDDDARMAGLELVRPEVANLHVFNWAAGQRLPLAGAAAFWRRVLSLVDGVPGEHYALLEFVTDDEPAAFLRDAATLRQLVCELASGCA